MRIPKRKYLLIFAVCFISRLVFKLVSGYDNFELFGDAIRYDYLSDRILKGDHSMDITAFITSPLYPYTMALAKILFAEHWQFVMVLYHFTLISISAVYICKISLVLFRSESTALLAGVLYIFYPLTMWYNFTLTQECSFQAFMIIFVYYFLRYIQVADRRSLILLSIFYFLAFASKSHIILLMPFVVYFLWKNFSFASSLIFLSIWIILSVPQSLASKIQYGTFTPLGFSSGSLFLVGHSDQTYPCLTNKIYEHPEIIEGGCDLDLIFHPPYEFEYYGKVNRMPYGKRNRTRFKIALEWIFDNPNKFWELKLNGLRRFLLPGLDHRIYSPLKWILSLILGLLIYLPAYYVIFRNYKNKPEDHFMVLSILTVIAIIFLGFYPQNRFRVISLEPLLIVYASTFYSSCLKKLFNNLKAYPEGSL